MVNRELTQKRKEAVAGFMKLPFSNSLSTLLDTLGSKLKDLGDNSTQEKEFVSAVSPHIQNPDVVYSQVTILLQSFNHPFGQYMQQYAIRFKQQYQDQVLHCSKNDPNLSPLLQTMTAETHAFTGIFFSFPFLSFFFPFSLFPCLSGSFVALASLLEKMIERYTYLDSMSLFVRRAIEDELFSSTSKILIRAFEKKHHTQDDSLFLKLCLLHDITPRELGVNPKFCLDESPEPGQEIRPSVPYHTAIVSLKKIAMAGTPSEKAHVLGDDPPFL